MIKNINFKQIIVLILLFLFFFGDFLNLKKKIKDVAIYFNNNVFKKDKKKGS